MDARDDVILAYQSDPSASFVAGLGARLPGVERRGAVERLLQLEQGLGVGNRQCHRR